MEYLFIYGLQMANILENILALTILGAAALIVASIMFYGINYDDITAENWE